jgi:hypothetical protein
MPAALLLLVLLNAPLSHARAPSCGFSTQGLKGGIQKLYEKSAKKGVKAISCVRTRECQAALVRYYNSIGQAGRAAKNSRHSTGDACDFSRRHEGPIRQLRAGLGTQRIDHSKRHGGGIHEQNPRGGGYRRGRGYTPRYK